MTAIIGPNSAHLSQDQIEIVDLLKEALAQALEGNVTTIGIALCMKKGFTSVMGGPQAAELNLAVDDLKRRILDAVLTSPKTQGAASRLRRMT